MTYHPLVSVIVPVYNTGNRLKQCLASIVNQGYPYIELIIVDDGSTDQSPAICDSFMMKDKRIRVYHIANSGVSEARNKGVRESHGEWLCFVDSDDWCDSWYISEFVDKITGYTDLIMQGFIKEKDGKEIRRKHLSREGTFSQQEIPDSFLENDLINFGSPCCKLFRRKVLDNMDKWFPTSYSYGEDTVFFFRYLQHCQAIECIGKEGYHYVEHSSDSLSQRVHHSLPLLLFVKDSTEALKTMPRTPAGQIILSKQNEKNIALSNKAFNNMFLLDYSRGEKRAVISYFKQHVRPLLNKKGLSLHELIFMELSSVPVGIQLLCYNFFARIGIIKT